jgi:hypothetical protein
MATNDLYPSTSPYYVTDVTNEKFLDFMNNRTIPALPSDVLYTLPMVYEFRPDLLAFDLYSDSRLWWVFAARNPNVLGPDPYFNFKTGTQFYLPTLDTLRLALGI